MTAFLATYFPRYVEYDFTASLEDRLDQVSAGQTDYKTVLSDFWRDFSAALAETADLRIGEVLERIDAVLAPHLYPPRADGGDPRRCPACGEGRLSMRTARTGGAFIGCSRYPECRYTRPFGPPPEDAEAAPAGERLLGEDGGEPIWLRDGRFGPYVQRGEATADNPKPPRASLPRGWRPEEMTLESALRLLSLPRQVGTHPEDGAPVEAGIGRFGPYVRHGTLYATLPSVEDVWEIGMNRAVELLAQKAAGRRGAGARSALPAGRSLGEHPEGGEIQVMPGRYGPYVKWGKINATIPRERDPETLTLEDALALIEAKTAAPAAGRKGSKGRGTTGKTATAADPAKTAARRTAKKASAKTAAPAPEGTSAGRSATGRTAARKATARPASGKPDRIEE
ncbi:putative domain of topoisomerase IA [Rubellimicrobium thermophilum DSM 16684]|uniref:Putative domain of topoisomerase IA n=1 Tax=Rubellimicrobium thermophilum DSM 16684 TaxID=1123069 RepID=S9R643_9RHOB|nr:putative domain of topoisomerase IA [Rubellimicrobium thermophilum DSM 16684]